MRGTDVASTVNRRDFILTAVSVAGGLMIGIGAARGRADAAAISAQPWNDDEYAPHEIDAWIAIDPDDSILIRYQRSEMGQGSMTALPMMMIEERNRAIGRRCGSSMPRQTAVSGRRESTVTCSRTAACPFVSRKS